MQKVPCSASECYKMALTTAALPTLYEYFTGGGIQTGLSANQPYFTLNDRNITLYSGAMHYFRVPKQHWRDRLKKMRAAGLNTVETYVPWNLHEPEPGNFDFGNGTSDMTDFLDVKQFLEMAKEEDLLAIVRPGPYICSEWDFGGLPSWLLKDKEMKVRTSQTNYMQHVTRYFNMLLPILALLQFTKGGPVIAFQVENEYGSTNQPGIFTPDKQYLEELRQLFIRNGIVELLFTSDSPTMSGTLGTLPEYFLQTANFGGNPENEFNRLKTLQPNKPVMAMEYWDGWFDHWTENHNTVAAASVANTLERILSYPASVNFYMFHGGTNWGFMNGANILGGATDNSGYQPDTTSYDYDAPLTEAGDYTEKYVVIKELIEKYNQVPIRTPQAPTITLRTTFPSVQTTQQLKIGEAMKQVPQIFESERVISMEQLPIGNAGQSYGYIVYRKTNLNIPANGTLKIMGRVCDTVMVLIDGQLVSKPLTGAADLNSFGYWRLKDSTLSLTPIDLQDVTLELVVENWGRNNFGHIDQFKQYKGLWQGGILINDEELLNWEITPLSFKKAWNTGLTGWHSIDNQINTPALYRFEVNIESPQDTFIYMSKWSKGIVIVNGFVLGRYALVGPQQTLYFPAPLQKAGVNEIIVFEHFKPASALEFTDDPLYYTPKNRRCHGRQCSNKV